MRHRSSCVASAMALAVAMLAMDSSAAQNTVPPQTVDPKACANQDRLRPGNGTAQQQPSTQGQTLSDKLERSEGVICPPLGIDPEVAIPPPGGGKTLVIPPPGSPGGDPSIRPK